MGYILDQKEEGSEGQHRKNSGAGPHGMLLQVEGGEEGAGRSSSEEDENLPD